jgi:hypothetical protein
MIKKLRNQPCAPKWEQEEEEEEKVMYLFRLRLLVVSSQNPNIAIHVYFKSRLTKIVCMGGGGGVT